MSDTVRLSRRRFLQVLAGTAGALVVGLPVVDAADAPVPAGWLGDQLYGLRAYVRIDPDGTVLIGARDPETGTGAATALARIVADELDADWSAVKVVGLGPDTEDVNGKPRFIYGHQLGGTGTSVSAAWNDLRPAGALARWLLLQAAARQLGLPADQLRSQWDLGFGGVIFHGAADINFKVGHVWDLNRFPGQDVGNSYLQLGMRFAPPHRP